jgi:hypothetical protein
MSSRIIESIQAKIPRAEQNIRDFELGFDAFSETRPYRFRPKDNPETGQRTYYLTKMAPVPATLTTIASDVLQNLRDSLDHIAYQLVLDARGGAKPEWPVHFPIAGSAADYPSRRRSVIKGVRQEVIDAIDATEPYKGGRGHALWQLSKLNNVEKHELLIEAGAFHFGVDVSPGFNREIEKILGRSPKIPPIVLKPAGGLSPLKVGDKLNTEPLDREMGKEARFAFQISLNVPGVVSMEPAIKTLQDLANLVRGITAALCKFLG